MDRLHELAAKAAAFADLLDQNRPLFSDAVCKGSLRFRGAANVAIDPASLHPSRRSTISSLNTNNTSHGTATTCLRFATGNGLARVRAAR